MPEISTSVYEVLNLGLVWVILVVLLQKPFIQSIKNYILNEKNQRASVEETFFKAKKREIEVNDFKLEVTKFQKFVDEIKSDYFDELPTHISSLPLTIENSLTVEFQIYQAKTQFDAS